MDNSKRVTMMQLCLSLESYLITESAQKKITGLSAMNDTKLNNYWMYLSDLFNGIY